MKRFIQKIISSLLVIVVLLAGVGFNLFVHHCQCEGKIHVSILNRIGCTHSHSFNDGECCRVSFIETVKVADQTCGCWNEVLKVKTDNFAGPQKVEVNQALSNYLTVIDWVDLHQPIQNHSYTNKTNWDNPPPNQTGKKICIKHHQLKIAHLL